jgi:putative RNA 2'-phosphotransferase
MSINYKHLSKAVARALRHHPARYGLELDAEGWVPVDELLAALRRKRDWHSLTLDDLIDMMARADKQRYELCDGKIRAFYGHSTPDKVQKTPAVPPDTLYHGTAPEAVRIILEEGLKPMNRQYVHLSTDEATARLVGARHASEPVILHILALDAHAAGIVFYLGNEDVWLADYVPPQFIRTP